MPMKKLSRLVLFASLILAGTGHISAQSCTRHSEPQGGFSICIPDSWTVTAREGQKYQGLFSPATEGFTPNMNFKEEMSTLPLSEYVASSARQILAAKEKLGATSIEPLGQSDFTTESGMRGIRNVFQTMYKGFLIRTIQYYFDAGSDRKLIVTGTSLDKNKEVFDRVFDRTVKSFRIG